MKKLLFILPFLALAFCACGTKSEENQMNLKEDLEQLVQCIMDSSMHFEDYQPLFDEVLDSIEADVLHNPDAGTRFAARKTPNNLLLMIRTSESVEKRDSISQLYDQRNRDILYTWYVQQLIDSTDNSPFTLLSYAAPYDTNGNTTRVSFTFSEHSNPEVEPVMIIVLPVVTGNPLVLFSEWDENGKEYSSDSYVLANKNIQVFVDSANTQILMSGKNFLRDMLEYQQMNVCYVREDAPDYKTVENDIFKQYVTAIPVDLYKFQEQYRAAHKWMEDYK